MAITLKLRSGPGAIPYDEIDLTGRAGPFESDPIDYDARAYDDYGRLRRVARSIHRRLVFPELQVLTDSEVEILRHWKQDRVLVSLNPNWNGNTVLFSRYARSDPATAVPGSSIGPVPTFTRITNSGNASATRLELDGRYRLITGNVPRFEPSATLNGLRPYPGLRMFGRHSNYFGRSHPQSSALIWTLGTGTFWAWEPDLPSIVADLGDGVGIFGGNSGDYIQQTVASYGGAGTISLGVWVQGEGTFSFKVSGGATGETANTLISPTAWTLLKLENLTATGASLTIQLFARAATSWCSVSAQQFVRAPRLFGYLHNVTNTTVYEVQEDALYYDFQIPFYATTLHVGLEMPSLYASGEQVILGVDHGSGARTVLKYDGTLGKFYFQKKASGINAQWTPERTAGQFTIISIAATKDNYIVYENNNFKVLSAVGALHSLSRGLNVGWDGITDANGWNGLVYFVRVDKGGLDSNEIAYVSNRYNDAEMRRWARLAEGRLFEITTPLHRMRAGKNFGSLELVEVLSHEHATTEEP